MEMTIREKLRYEPNVGDVLIYLDGTNFKIKEVRTPPSHVLMENTIVNHDTPWRAVAKIRTDLIENKCFLCRKEDKKCP